MEVLNSRRMVNIGIVTMLYFVLTLALRPFAFGEVQFRISEILVLLCAFNPDHILSVTLGCFMANIFSTMSYDMLFGTLGTLIAAVVIYMWREKPLFLLSLIPVMSNAVLVGFELRMHDEGTFWKSAAWVALGEFVSVSVIGVILLSLLRRKKGFMKLITAGIEQKKE